MTHFTKMAKLKFYLLLFAANSLAMIAAARYYGNMTIPFALLMALAATTGPAFSIELITMLVKRRRHWWLRHRMWHRSPGRSRRPDGPMAVAAQAGACVRLFRVWFGHRFGRWFSRWFSRLVMGPWHRRSGAAVLQVRPPPHRIVVGARIDRRIALPAPSAWRRRALARRQADAVEPEPPLPVAPWSHDNRLQRS